jgi:hypothetical protein
MYKINFRNAVQAALFTHELVGQISDGMWENARPQRHWLVWAEAEVGVNPEKLGKNFLAIKQNYDFSSTDLLDVVGERMLNICNMTENNVPSEAIGTFNDYDAADFKSESTHMIKRKAELLEYFTSFEAFEASKKGSYDMFKMKKELNEMKSIIRKIFE